jgi:hypothetical protein
LSLEWSFTWSAKRRAEWAAVRTSKRNHWIMETAGLWSVVEVEHCSALYCHYLGTTSARELRVFDESVVTTETNLPVFELRRAVHMLLVVERVPIGGKHSAFLEVRLYINCTTSRLKLHDIVCGYI